MPLPGSNAGIGVNMRLISHLGRKVRFEQWHLNVPIVPGHTADVVLKAAVACLPSLSVELLRRSGRPEWPLLEIRSPWQLGHCTRRCRHQAMLRCSMEVWPRWWAQPAAIAKTLPRGLQALQAAPWRRWAQALEVQGRRQALPRVFPKPAFWRGSG